MSGPDRVRSAVRSVFGSTGRAVGELSEADAVLRTALPLSRRIGFVSVAGGVGTTSTVSSVASLLARRRSGMVLATDAGGGYAGLERRLLEPADGVRADEGRADGEIGSDRVVDRLRRRTARSAAEARQGLVRTESGLHLLDLIDPAESVRRPTSVASWTEQLSPVVRFFDLVITDWGVRAPTMDLQDVADTGHVLVVVSRAERHAATAAASAIDALARSSAAPRFVLALVDVGHTSDRSAEILRTALGVPVVLLPHERVRGDRLATGSRAFSSTTRTAHIRLAAAVMDQVLTSQTSGARMPARSDAVTDARGDRPRHSQGMGAGMSDGDGSPERRWGAGTQRTVGRSRYAVVGTAGGVGVTTVTSLLFSALRDSGPSAPLLLDHTAGRLGLRLADGDGVEADGLEADGVEADRVGADEVRAVDHRRLLHDLGPQDVGVAALSDSGVVLIVVTAANPVGVQLATEVLDGVRAAHGPDGLARTVVVLAGVSGRVRIGRGRAGLQASGARAVLQLAPDLALAAGGRVPSGRLSRRTQRFAAELAGAVAPPTP